MRSPVRALTVAALAATVLLHALPARNVLAIIALIAGLLGLVLGGAAFARTRTAPRA